MTSHITSETKKEEATTTTTTFDIITWMHVRRLKWVGHTLPIEGTRLIKQTLEHIYENQQEGDVPVHLPAAMNWEELMS